jgi:baculoviral IAP repeat-containing protein 7/8
MICDDSIAERINTFIGWNVSFICPDEMARAGFYYTKHKDRVRCAYCEIELDNWSIGKCPVSQHARYSPECDYVVRLLEQRSNLASPEYEQQRCERRLDNFQTYTTPSLPVSSSLSSSSSSSSATTCIVCMDRDRCIMFSPCKHIVSCDHCAALVDSCVVCRSIIECRTKIYLN